jgi:hypothetical protein
MVAVSAFDVREWLIAVGTVVAALGTLAAVVVALALAQRAERSARRRRPSLELSFDPTHGIRRELLSYSDRSGPGAYVRFGVKNAPGKDAAEDVEVLLAEILVPSFTEDDQAIDVSFPGFQWTHTTSTRLTIPAGVVRDIDIARLHELPPDPGLASKLELLMSPPPADGRQFLDGGTYELRLTVSARNADAVTYRTRLTYNPARSAFANETVKVLDPPYAER